VVDDRDRMAPLDGAEKKGFIERLRIFVTTADTDP